MLCCCVAADDETTTRLNRQTRKQVALAMMKAGKSVNVGHHIPYVMCSIKGASSPAERARHPDDVIRSNGELEVDVEW